MQVKLAAITQSLVKEQNLSAEELLVYIARVSNPSNQLNTETSDKLIGYMIKNKHWSPFDMIDMTVEVTTSRAVAHQILRHWSIKPQEFSQRYAEAVSFETIEFRKSASSNRQSSEDIISEISFIYDNPPINGKVVFSEDSSEELRRYTLDVAEVMDIIKNFYK